MPKYRVETDQGNFEVELDREPTSPAELQSLVSQHLAAQPPAPPAQPAPAQNTVTKAYQAVAKPVTGAVAAATAPQTGPDDAISDSSDTP